MSLELTAFVRVVYSAKHQLHDPDFEVTAGRRVGAFEVGQRVEAIRSVLEADGTFSFEAPVEHGLEPILAVHGEGLVRFLESAWPVWRTRGMATEAIVPDTFLHPSLRTGMEAVVVPDSPCGQSGFYCFDTATPIVAGTWEATRTACDAALTAAELVLAGERAAYALARPPGHHAARDMYGGYCYLNQAAIAANWITGRGGTRVAVLDLDFHHGNGTQQIFYDRGDVLYASIHADPTNTFPYFAGYASETGSGDGRDATFNQPLPAGTDDAAYLAAVDRAIERVAEFRAGIVVVSLGLDTYGQDPIGNFALTTPVYHEAGRRVAEAGLPLVIIQEGGYHLPSLGRNAYEWLLGAEGRPAAFAAAAPAAVTS
ncbi:MAG TPA: histone deacetylase family protein [Candidatus Limnocylindria bacterium]